MDLNLEENVHLPVLRGDIQLNEAPPEPEGTPTWTLYDPAANKYFKIGWLEFECLSRFEDCRTVRELVEKLKKETPLSPTEDDIKPIMMFLVYNHLVVTSGEGVVPHFEAQRKHLDRPWWERLLHSYLFFMIPLFKPQAFLNKTYPYVKPLLTRKFMALVCLLLLYGIFLSVQRLDELTTTFMRFMSFEGVMLLLATTIFTKVIHELGHAYVATKYRVPVTTVGVAFIVLYPVLYTETTNAWKLQSRRDRLNIAAAGMMAELALASVALILWNFLSPGALQSICFMVSTVTIAASLAINLSPMMKYDGYYIFSDLVGVDNLQDRSFAFAKWQLRRILWGWDDLPPEAVSRERQTFLCAFGYTIWIYRFTLYSGIALLVNHIFFQPLGMFLMFVEIYYFMTLPVIREAKVWARRWRDILPSFKGRIVILIAALALMAVFIPFPRSIEIPAVLHAQNYARLYSPISAKIEEVLVQEGQTVEAGQILFRLSSTDLDYNIKVVSRRLEDLQAIRSSSQAVTSLAQKRVTIDSEIETVRKELDGYKKVKDQLEVKAPFSGQIKNVDPTLHAGQWVRHDFLLGLLADDSARVFSGYAREQDIGRLNENSQGIFYADYSPFRTFPVLLKNIDKTAAYEIFWPELSSVQRGPIPAERGPDGRIRPLPRYNIYAVSLDLAPEKGANPSFPGFVARGRIRIRGASQSLANFLVNNVFSAFVAEGGF